MTNFFRLLRAGLKWVFLILIGVEVSCFILITVTNLLLFGHPWEGSRVNYDAYALFLNVEGVVPTLHNPPESDLPGTDRAPRRLWLLGGSTMRGGWVGEGETIPSYLAEIINRPGNPDKVIVTNYGENSFNSLLETKYLQKLLIETTTPPDLVIFYDGANDCSYFNQYRTAQAHYGYRRLRALIESHRRSMLSLLKPLNAAIYASFTREAFDKFRQITVLVHPENPAPKEMATATEKRYDHVRRLAGAYGADFLLIWQPFLWVETAEVDPLIKAKEEGLRVMGANFLEVRRNVTITYNLIADRLKAKPYFVDLRNALTTRRVPIYEADGVHLKPAGNKMVAKQLAKVLQHRGWLKRVNLSEEHGSWPSQDAACRLE
ncbi:MAG: SGNH/GDSL hydrolase family protein [Desulfobaccales bacterium]